MFGIKSKPVAEEPKVDLEAQRKLEAKQAVELAIKEFTNLRSICLDCKNAFIERFIENPAKPDPMNVVCKKKLEVWGAKSKDLWASEFAQCVKDVWNRKTLSCSDFEKKD